MRGAGLVSAGLLVLAVLAAVCPGAVAQTEAELCDKPAYDGTPDCKLTADPAKLKVREGASRLGRGTGGGGSVPSAPPLHAT